MITVKEVQEIIITRDIESREAFNKIQDEFNLVQDMWTEKFANEDDPKKASEIQKEWDDAIDKAQSKFDEAVEELSQKEDAQLKEDKEESEKAFKEFEEKDEADFLQKLKERKEAKEARFKKLEDDKNEVIKLEPDNPKLGESLFNKFLGYYKEGLTNSKISSKFKEDELILILGFKGVTVTSKGTKLDKVKMIIELL